MKSDELNEKLREYARKLSPNESERKQVGEVYASFQELLGTKNCLQIGSYPRFTAITPVHDLDILYILGSWDEDAHEPLDSLQDLLKRIQEEYINPTDYEVEASLQTHSVTMTYLKSGQDVFSVDIVPAYIWDKNDFLEDRYKVPEIVQKAHKNRAAYYERLSKEHGEMQWITSDPRGYIKVASNTDSASNGEFRKSVKLVKKWKDNLEDADNELKLKSFHLEQVVTSFFQEKVGMQVFDAIFEFFYELPEILENPNHIADRANSDKFIDDYLEKFTKDQKAKIKDARDNLLIKLERFGENSSVDKLLEVDFAPRIESESFLFDSGIKTMVDPSLVLSIDGFVRATGSFSSGWLKETEHFKRNGVTSGGNLTRTIDFSLKSDKTGAGEYWWKIRNSNDSREPRGDIHKGSKTTHTESTAFPSKSYVECYAIRDGVCVAKDRLNIRIV